MNQNNIEIVAEVYSFKEIIKEYKNLRIPYNQRGFSWEKKHLETIIKDVNEALKNKSDKYYIGPITLFKRDDGSYDIIDGQQRLTTIILIIKYIAIKLKENKNTDEQQSLGYDYLKLIYPDNEPIIKHERSIEKGTFKNILDDVNLEEKSERKEELERDKILAINNILPKAIHETIKENNTEELFKFIKFFVEDSVFVVTICTNIVVAYQIFETLNDRGKKLAPIDLIRNYLFANIKADHVHDYWIKWDKACDRIDKMQPDTASYTKGYSEASRGSKNMLKLTIDEHMQSIFTSLLVCHTGKWIQPKGLFAKFKDYSKTPNNKSPEELVDFILDDETLKSYRLTYLAEDKNELKEMINFASDYDIIKPLVFVLFYKKYDSETITKALRMTVYLMKRTQILGLRVNMYNDTFAKIANEIYASKHKKDNLLRDVYNHIQKADLIDDTKFEEKLSITGKVADDIAKDAFICIYRNKRESNAVNLEKVAELHIEHILPEKYHKKNWGANFSEQAHNIYHQKLGNLMLLEGPKNRKLSRKPFDEKKVEYKTSDLKHINFLIDKKNNNKGEYYREWKKRTVEERQKEVAKEITKAWRIADSSKN